MNAVRRTFLAVLVASALFGPRHASAQGTKADTKKDDKKDASSTSSAADEVSGDFVDSSEACDELEASTERARAAWEKAQAPVAYREPVTDTLLGAPWGGLFKWMGESKALLAATFIPSVGAQIRSGVPGIVLAFPWSFPIAKAMACSRVNGFLVHKHKAARFMLEPGITSSTGGPATYVRPGFRFLYQRAAWVVGFGLGVGSVIEIAGNKEPMRLSASPEVALRFGRCCEPGYFTLIFRKEWFFAGHVRDTYTTTLGYSFF